MPAPSTVPARPPVTSHPVVEAVLAHYSGVVGNDLETYRNHVYRGLTYQLGLLGRDDASNEMALAWVVHDLGIWTANTFDYIPPSVELAQVHAAEAEVANLPLVVEMVGQHHKIRSVADPVVDSFRRADRIEVLHGSLRGELGRGDVKATTTALPYCGFHAFLVRQAARRFVRHPLNPLPMYRW